MLVSAELEVGGLGRGGEARWLELGTYVTREERNLHHCSGRGDWCARCFWLWDMDGGSIPLLFPPAALDHQQPATSSRGSLGTDWISPASFPRGLLKSTDAESTPRLIQPGSRVPQALLLSVRVETPPGQSNALDLDLEVGFGRRVSFRAFV